eukprot:COSAG02_NODE_813_length_16901_cov_45.562135_3_plen_189_part_00
MADNCFQVRNVGDFDTNDPTRWSCDEEGAGAWGALLATSPLSVAWWCNCLGVLTTCLIMAAAIYASDWEQLSKDAQAELVEDDDKLAASGTQSHASEERAAANWTRSTIEDLLLSGPQLMGRTFSGKERDTLESGEHWVGSVADDNHDGGDDALVDADLTWPRSNRHARDGPQINDRSFRQTAPNRDG